MCFGSGEEALQTKYSFRKVPFKCRLGEVKYRSLFDG